MADVQAPAVEFHGAVRVLLSVTTLGPNLPVAEIDSVRVPPGEAVRSPEIDRSSFLPVITPV